MDNERAEWRNIRMGIFYFIFLFLSIGYFLFIEKIPFSEILQDRPLTLITTIGISVMAACIFWLMDLYGLFTFFSPIENEVSLILSGKKKIDLPFLKHVLLIVVPLTIAGMFIAFLLHVIIFQIIPYLIPVFIISTILTEICSYVIKKLELD